MRPDIYGSSAVLRSLSPMPSTGPRSLLATPTADLYQLLAYCTVLGLNRGHLIYAKGSEEPAHHRVRQSGIEIICRAVNLGAEPGRVVGQVRAIAELIAGASKPLPGPSSPSTASPLVKAIHVIQPARSPDDRRSADISRTVR